MNKSSFILGIVSISVLCLSACGSKPNMSFEEALDTITHSPLQEMMESVNSSEENFNISVALHVPEDNVDANIDFSANSKKNKENSEWESKFSLKINASWDWYEWRETININWDAMIKYLSNAIYLKLNNLSMSGPEDIMWVDPSALSWAINQRYSIELTGDMLDKLLEEMPEGFDINNFSDKKLIEKFANELKTAINNEWSVVYSGIYTEYNWYNAWKFSINKEKVFEVFKNFAKELIPTDEFEEIEEIDTDEIFEDFPFKDFEWYLVITWKKDVAIVIENLNVEDYYSTSKIHGTFGKDKYEISVSDEEDDFNFIFSAVLNKTHYDLSLKSNDKEFLRWTVTPSKSKWKISIDFKISINIESYDDEVINIPLKWSWSREEISDFKVEVPENSINLLDIFSERMNTAQWRARDVARKNDMSQIQTAIVTSQQDKWMWPWLTKGASKWIPTSEIEEELIEAWMRSVPTDPDQNVINYGLWNIHKKNSVKWDYLYLITKRNWTTNNWFVLMWKTEVEWASNRVVCKNGTWLVNWYITNDTDIARISKCTTITKWDSCSNRAWTCTYTDEEELRYILLY